MDASTDWKWDVISGACIKTHQYFVMIDVAHLQRLAVPRPFLEPEAFVEADGGMVG